MTLLDAHALIAFVVREPAEAEVRGLLRAGDAGITTTNLAEAVDVLSRRYSVGAERSRPVFESLLEGSLKVRALDLRTSWRVGGLRAEHYDRATCPLSLADCALLGAAERGDSVASADRYVLAVARLEGITVVPLPDSSGRRPPRQV